MKQNQTAVEWLVEQINGKGWGDFRIDIPKETIDQALKMEKEQLRKASFTNYPYIDPVINKDFDLSDNELFEKIKKEFKVQNLIIEMENDRWYVKLGRWWRLQVWLFTCRTRKFWDKTYGN